MRTSVFCPLCGIPTGRLPTDTMQPTTENDLKWWHKVRFISPIEAESASFVTGIGYLRRRGPGHVPLHPEETYSQNHITIKHLDSCYPGEPRRTTPNFPLHAACWSILCARLPTADPSEIARYLFQIFSSTVRDEQGHRSFFQDWSTRDSPCVWRYNTQDFYYTDPGLALDSPTIPEKDDLQMQAYKSTSTSILTYNGNGSGDIFARLPPEVLQEIAMYLPTKAIPDLRISSKVLAQALTLDSLTQQFWRTRFSLASEMAFAYSLLVTPNSHPSAPVDWRSWYFHIKNVLRSSSDEGSPPSSNDGFDSLRNRRNIWDMLGPLVRIIQLLCDKGGLQGHRISWDAFPVLGAGGLDVGMGAKATYPADEVDSNSAGYMRNKAFTAPFCSELEIRGLCFPRQAAFRLGISFIPFCGREYVSGIRVVDSGKSTGLGLVLDGTETRLELQPGDGIQRVDVILDVRGVVGLCFVISRQSGLVSRHVAGEDDVFEESTESISLFPKAGTRICGLGFGFDAYKVVSAGLVECDSTVPVPPVITT